MKQRTERRIRKVTVNELFSEFEEKYHMTSAEFYERFEALEFPDDGSDQFFDFMTWAGLIEAMALKNEP